VIQLRRTRNSFMNSWWIDKSRFVVLRDDQKGALDPTVEGSTTLWTTTKLNEPIPDDLFVFKPPPGARLVPALQSRARERAIPPGALTAKQE
jgi:hypothetical protein